MTGQRDESQSRVLLKNEGAGEQSLGTSGPGALMLGRTSGENGKKVQRDSVSVLFGCPSRSLRAARCTRSDTRQLPGRGGQTGPNAEYSRPRLPLVRLSPATFDGCVRLF